MVGVIGCRCVACSPVWTQMVVDAGEGKEIRKKKERKKENRNLLGTDGRHNCVQTRCMCTGCGCR